MGAPGRQPENPKLAGLLFTPPKQLNTKFTVSPELLTTEIILHKAAYKSFGKLHITSLLKILIVIRVGSPTQNHDPYTTGERACLPTSLTSMATTLPWGPPRLQSHSSVPAKFLLALAPLF